MTDSLHRQARVSALGFDWPHLEGVLDKIAEELEEIRDAWKNGKKEAAGEELGDLLLATVNAARFLAVDPAIQLHRATDKLCRRVKSVQDLLEKEGRLLESCTAGELNEAWNRVKSMEDKGLKHTP